CARHSQRRAAMARPLRHVPTEQHDLSGSSREDSSNQIEQSRLAGAVGPDDRLALAGHDRKRDAAHRAQSAKAFGQAPQLEGGRVAVRLHLSSLADCNEAAGAHARPGQPKSLITEFTGREVAAVDRRLEELLLIELAELVDVRVGLDDGIPELLL